MLRHVNMSPNDRHVNVSQHFRQSPKTLIFNLASYGRSEFRRSLLRFKWGFWRPPLIETKIFADSGDVLSYMLVMYPVLFMCPAFERNACRAKRILFVDFALFMRQADFVVSTHQYDMRIAFVDDYYI